MRRVKILFDENLSHHHAAFLNQEFGKRRNIRIDHVRSLGWSGKPEADFLKEVANLGWTFVTYDRNERTRGHTVPQLKTIGVREIHLGKFFDHIDGWERAKWLVNRIEAMVEHAAAMQAGSVSLWRKREGSPTPL